ncbi:upstream activation factor subunit UAF30-like [Chenopodium quinoa]|uniref:upstream activation factor subunit UAF30-like n=1 Tax=Chenopodium quinoa TaxID=63459 RepID=UPI000B78DFD7|nr:upstream activation factor subunit UAF30-like [Chenopodium quinoa]XP_021758760.1 upstream activation factor subunit UAF30-like [Chenopodium quinoa]
MATLRTIGGKCRALMAAAKASTAASVESSATKTTAAKKSKPVSAANATRGILKPVPVSPTLSQFIGSNEASRTEVVKKIWDYIKLHNLQNPENKKEIICDEKLKVLFSGKDRVGFLEIAKLLSVHFVKTA